MDLRLHARAVPAHRKVLLVGAGYLLALAAGAAAGVLYDLSMAAMPYDTSGGMYAGGQLITSLGVFLAVALVPTVLAFWFLRGNARVWQALAVASLGFAGLGLAAVLLPGGASGPSASVAGLVLELMRIGHLLGVPLWTAAFALFAWLAPTPTARRVLLAAVGVELVAGLCVLGHWLGSVSPR